MYFKIRTVQIIFLSQAVCGRAHIAKGADEIGQNRLIRPLVVSGNFIGLYSLCGGIARGEVCVRPASLRYGFARSEVCARGERIKILIYR